MAQIIHLAEKIAEVEKAINSVRVSDAAIAHGGGGDHTGGMDAWQTSVENRLGEIATDIRDLRKSVGDNLLWTLAAFAAGFMILLGVVAKGFHWF